MRNLVLSLFSILLITSCTDQEKIAQYETQLKESNEALEEVINYRRMVMMRRAAENPAKADSWKNLSEQYYSSSLQIISHLNQPSFIDSVVNALEFNEEINHGQWDSVASKLKKLHMEASVIGENIVLNQLNQTLQIITNYSSTTYCGFTLPYIVPKVIPGKDSSLVLLTSNVRMPDHNFIVTFNEPGNLRFHSFNTLGYTFISSNSANKKLSGTVDIISDDDLWSWKTKFSKDSIYKPTLMKTP